MRGRIEGACRWEMRDASAARLFSWWLRDEIAAIRFPDVPRV